MLDFIKYELTINKSWGEKYRKNVVWLSNLNENFVIFKSRGQLILAKSIDEKPVFFKIDISKKQIRLSELPKIDFKWNTNNKYSDLPYTIIFYSNFFDSKKEMEKKGLINISTNYLLHEDRNRYAIRKLGFRTDYELLNVDNIIAFNMREIERQLDFLDKIYYDSRYVGLREKFSFIPDKLYIKASKVGKDKIYNSLNNIARYKDNDKIKELQNTFFEFDRLFKEEKEREERPRELFRIEYKETLFYRELRSVFFNTRDPVKYLLKCFADVEDGTFLNRIGKLIEYLSKSKSAVLDYDRLFSVLETRNIQISYSNFDSHEQFHSKEAVIIIDTNTLSNYTGLGNLYRIYKTTVGDRSHFLDFSWRNISTGELSLFNLFSRFYYVQRSTLDPPLYLNFGINSTLFLIDEGDTGFHPKWQREYLSILLGQLTRKWSYTAPYKTKEICNLYVGNQFIITTHSPFIISDLPKENIIFLERDENGNCKVVDGLSERKQTFGANIHSLFSDSFFLDNLIGKFAEKKINEVINFLNDYPNVSNSSLSLSEVEKVINIIGEPILQRHLKRQLSSIKDKEELRTLRLKVKELKDKLKEKND